MSKDDQISLKNQAIISYDSELRLKKYFGNMPLEMPALILARLLIINSDINPEIMKKLDSSIISFSKSSSCHDRTIWSKAYNLAKEINNL